MAGSVIIVLRLSAMGDVAMTLPAIRSLAESGRKVVIVTKSPFKLFFSNIKGVEVFTAETTGRHRGVRGIIRLYRDINEKYTFDRVVDLHDVLRSKVLVFLFRLAGYHVSVIDKGRKEKKRFIKEKKTAPLKNSVTRYLDTFLKSGFDLSPANPPLFELAHAEKEAAENLLASFTYGGKRKIAIAPFARHETKSWGPVKIKELIDLLGKEYNAKFFLMGGPDEVEALSSIAEGRKDTNVIAGKYGLRKELAMLSQMELMISMDSSNMHLAALSGIKTVSIWGGTHPDTGFAPYGNQQHLFVQVPLSSLDCRPCTVYGSGRCKRSNDKFKCLSDISAEMVLEQIKTSGIL